MFIGTCIQGWRLARKQSVESLASVAGLPHDLLEQIESGQTDPTAGTIESLAHALQVPPSWLFDHPGSFEYLFGDSSDDEGEEPNAAGTDPVTNRILAGSRADRSLFVLLTALMQAGDPKLLRAAEMSLRSLVKQSRQATVPWQQRPSGHFEPPSD
ncbi:helix-turn-helix domain-containing protein [Nitrospira sp. CMX1]|nr:helix-turn-helix domain-containing protein [Nitrospira sp.]MBX3325989.1 helix-turn-helix domain-containing protein [Nitrospira sp.]